MRSGALVFAIALLQACGGDDDNSPDPVASISTTEVSVSAEPGDADPMAEIGVLVSNAPTGGFYVLTDSTHSGIYFTNYDANTRLVRVSFRTPSSLPDGSYSDTVDVRVCSDPGCVEQIDGSPFEIQVTYEISGGRNAVLHENFAEATTTTLSADRPLVTLSLTFDRPAAYYYSYEGEVSGEGLSYVELEQPSGPVAEVYVAFQWGSDTGPGRHDGSALLRVCYEPSCLREVGGSPFTISTRLNVHAAPEPDVEPMPVQGRTVLTYNVVDAEFSKTLNAVIMVGDEPVNALYVYDVATGTESRAPLVRTPKAVSVAPDGMSAAVGHDALISIVDLGQVGQPGAPEPSRLFVPFDIFDVATDGHGKVHVMPTYLDLDLGIRSVDIATGIITSSSGRTVQSVFPIRLHPSGDFLYSDAGESLGKLVKWDITSGAAVAVHESPYNGEHETCYNFWFKESGATIYTACGATFHSSTDLTEDLLYSGSLELFGPAVYYWRMRSLSQSDAVAQIALVEETANQCDPDRGSYPCYTHLALYESEFLDRQVVYAIAPVAVDGIDYAQVGTFVFHDTAGRKILLSKLDLFQNIDVIHCLSIVP